MSDVFFFNPEGGYCKSEKVFLVGRVHLYRLLLFNKWLEWTFLLNDHSG